MTNKEYRLNLLIEMALKENWFNRFQWKMFNVIDFDEKLDMLDSALERKDVEFKKYLEESLKKYNKK